MSQNTFFFLFRDTTDPHGAKMPPAPTPPPVQGPAPPAPRGQNTPSPSFLGRIPVVPRPHGENWQLDRSLGELIYFYSLNLTVIPIFSSDVCYLLASPCELRRRLPPCATRHAHALINTSTVHLRGERLQYNQVINLLIPNNLMSMYNVSPCCQFLEVRGYVFKTYHACWLGSSEYASRIIQGGASWDQWALLAGRPRPHKTNPYETGFSNDYRSNILLAPQ